MKQHMDNISTVSIVSYITCRTQLIYLYKNKFKETKLTVKQDGCDQESNPDQPFLQNPFPSKWFLNSFVVAATSSSSHTAITSTHTTAFCIRNRKHGGRAQQEGRLRRNIRRISATLGNHIILLDLKYVLVFQPVCFI